jgi:hypothetical protein
MHGDAGGLPKMFRELIGTLVWFAANGLYIDLRRKGRGGLARIIFFFMGMPATWLWLFLVPEGSRKEELASPRDDYHDLLNQIRRERALGPGLQRDVESSPDGGPAGAGEGNPKHKGDGPKNHERADHTEDDPHAEPPSG